MEGLTAGEENTAPGDNAVTVHVGLSKHGWIPQVKSQVEVYIYTIHNT